MSREAIPSPWYRHFWPWFVVGLLGVSIAGSLTTVVIAFRLGNLELPAVESSVDAGGASPRSRPGSP
jgi:hypothetical protein